MSTSSSVTESHERFREFLNEEGLRLTQEREQIAEVVFDKDGHFEAEELLYAIRRQEESVSRATIYRTLELLVQSGELTKVEFGDGYSLYETTGDRVPHGHLYCKQCGEVIEFPLDDIKQQEETVCQEHDFLGIEFKHQIHGYCSNCRDVVDLN
jgi:Fur family ferric uptake transcriptional regulator